MLSYIAEIRDQLISNYGCQQNEDGTLKTPPDGAYPMLLNGKLDMVIVRGGLLFCCNFIGGKTALKEFQSGALEYYTKLAGLPGKTPAPAGPPVTLSSEKIVTESAYVFETHLYADISTVHITKEDGQALTRRLAPHQIAEYDEGAFFYTADFDYDEAEVRGEFSEMSKAFQDLMVELWRQKIPFARFDRDGGEVEGAPTFEW